MMRPLRTLATLIGTGALLVGTAAAAQATSTPNGGPDVNFIGTNVSFTPVGSSPIACAPFDLAGSLVNPGSSRAFGDPTAVLNSFNTGSCSGPGTVDPSGFWGFAVTGNPTGTVWPARLTDITASVDSTSCAYEIAGEVDGVFNSASQTFVATSSDVQIATNPVGFLCPILGVAQGQNIDVSGSWTNVPPSGSSPITLATP